MVHADKTHHSSSALLSILFLGWSSNSVLPLFLFSTTMDEQSGTGEWGSKSILEWDHRLYQFSKYNKHNGFRLQMPCHIWDGVANCFHDQHIEYRFLKMPRSFSAYN